MDAIIARLDRSLILDEKRNVVVVRDARRRHLCKLQDATSCQDLCGHRYTQPFLVDWWLEKTKTPSDNLCPYCNHSGDRPGVLLRAERALNPRNLLLPLVGRQVEDVRYDPAVILNQEQLFKALFRNKVQAIEKLVPEFYGRNQDGEPFCPLGMNQDAPLQIGLLIGKGSFGTVFRLRVNNEHLKTKLDVPVVVKALHLESDSIAAEFTVFEIPNTRGMQALLTSSYMNELLLSSLASKLVTRRHNPCPNFPVVFGFFTCGQDDDDDDGKEEEGETTGDGDSDDHVDGEGDDAKTGYILMEALDADFSSSNPLKRRGIYTLIDKGVSLTAEMLRGVAFQISFAIAMLGDQYGMTQNDAKVDNVLAKVLVEGQPYVWNGHDLSRRDILFEYTVGSTTFVLPNSGVLAKISDFGIGTSYGDPMVMLRSTAGEKRKDIPEFSLQSKNFRPGADISYFVANFTQVTCFEATVILKEQARMETDQSKATNIRRRVAEIIALANEMLFELIRQRGSLGKRKKGEHRNFTDKIRRQFKEASSIEEGWNLASKDNVFRPFTGGIPGPLLSQKVNAHDFLLNCPAFDGYKPATALIGETVQMGHHSGLAVPTSTFAVIPD